MNMSEYIYISYRAAKSLDMNLADEYVHHVHIHTSSNIPPLPEYKRTNLLYVSSINSNTYKDVLGMFVMNIIYKNITHCRFEIKV